jgi:hypothetical protein
LRLRKLYVEFEKEMKKGNFRVKVSSYKLDTVVNNKLEDYYVIDLWKSEDLEVQSLKE